MTEIADNVPIPPEDPQAEQQPTSKPARKPRAARASTANAARARKAKTTEAEKLASGLINALKFISIVSKKIGTVSQQHCFISGNWAAASNGVITAAAKIEEDLSACPHTLQLIDALQKCGEELSITQLAPNTLSVKSDKFRALIPCCTFEEVPISPPDERIAALDDRIKAGFAELVGLLNESAQQAHFAALLLQSGSMVATNGFALLEYWHGFDLPPALLIPRAAAVAVAKAAPALVGFGYSETSVTFWFENDSFIKTQLYAERYLNYQAVFKDGLNPWPLPDEFFKAVRYIKSFSRNGIVYFDSEFISSHEHETEASTYKVEGLPDGMGFNAEYLLILEKAFKNVDFDVESNKVYFFGENSRGVLMGIDLKAPQPEAQQSDATSTDFEDDDIPF